MIGFGFIFFLFAVSFTSLAVWKFYHKMKPNTLYIIRGIPGSGKTTYGEKLAMEKGIKYFETDQYMLNDDGEYEWTMSRLRDAIEKCYNDVWRELSKEESSVIVGGVFSRWAPIRNYIELADSLDYNICIICCVAQYDNMHNVPVDTLTRMKEKFVPNAGLPHRKGIQYIEYDSRIH